MRAASWASLPRDVMLQIVSCLDDNQAARAALRCCSKELRSLVDHCTTSFQMDTGEMLPFVLERLNKSGAFGDLDTLQTAHEHQRQLQARRHFRDSCMQG